MIPREPGRVSLWQLPAFAKHSRGSEMFLLAFKPWYLAERAANVGHLKTFNGVRLILAFGPAGFSDLEAAQACP